MERPAASEPSAVPEGPFPRRHAVPRIGVGSAGDIGKIDVTSFRIAVPPEHAVDRSLQLDAVRLVDAAGIDPELLQPVLLRLTA